MALSFAVTGTTWRWLFDPRGGINQLPTALGLDAWDFRWLNNRQAYTFNWGAMSDLAVGVLVMILLAVFVLLLIRRRFLAAIYYGVVMALILMWIASDILTYDASAADSNMHGTFHWHDMLDFVSMVLVVAFLLVVVRLLWLGKRRAVIWFGIPAALLLVWYVTGGPERLPRLNIPEAELPYGFNLALVGVIIAAVWQLSGYTMAMYLAGIRGVPEELREAARVDGCNEFQVYTKVVLPLLSPITLSAAIVLGHISLKIFDLIFAMTGPDYLPVTVPGVQVYSMFRSNEFAKGSAIAIVLLIMVAVIIIPYLATSLRSEHEL
ncbi:MAG: sugar ABC transporter permease [Chloroflexi bacterium]|nr:sugar ABC transporter permease [Chloroflexota bacterium]